MIGEDLSWRLRVVADEDFGSGFAVTRTRALTCAHTIESGPSCEITPFGRPLIGPVGKRILVCPVRPVTGWPENRRADLAIVELSEHTGSVAPLGPRARPAAGTVVTVFGTSNDSGVELAAADFLGLRARARIAGPDASGYWLELNPVDAHQGWVERGFSGAAAIDETTGLVVGMVVVSDVETRTAAWLIPLDTLADLLKPESADLAEKLAGDPLETDAGFYRFRELLEAGRYGEAMGVLQTVEPRFRSEPAYASEIYFHWALTMLAGVRPAHHSAQTVEAVRRVLTEACRLDPRSPHARALHALVHEDFYRVSAIGGPRPDSTGLDRVTARRAAEILRHVPAPNCPTWQTLHHTMDRARTDIR